MRKEGEEKSKKRVLRVLGPEDAALRANIMVAGPGLPATTQAEEGLGGVGCALSSLSLRAEQSAVSAANRTEAAPVKKCRGRRTELSGTLIGEWMDAELSAVAQIMVAIFLPGPYRIET